MQKDLWQNPTRLRDQSSREQGRGSITPYDKSYIRETYSSLDQASSFPFFLEFSSFGVYIL